MIYGRILPKNYMDRYFDTGRLFSHSKPQTPTVGLPKREEAKPKVVLLSGGRSANGEPPLLIGPLHSDEQQLSTFSQSRCSPNDFDRQESANSGHSAKESLTESIS